MLFLSNLSISFFYYGLFFYYYINSRLILNLLNHLFIKFLTLHSIYHSFNVSIQKMNFQSLTFSIVIFHPQPIFIVYLHLTSSSSSYIFKPLDSRQYLRSKHNKMKGEDLKI